jgi:hypothetical protein
MSRPTQDEVYEAYRAKVDAQDRHVEMCREVIAGLRFYAVDDLNSVAEACVQAHEAFRRIMAPLSGTGPRLI